MKKEILFSVIAILIGFNSNAQQRVIAECTINYIVTGDSTMDAAFLASLKSTTKTVYIKGNKSRTDLISPSFSQSVIYDKTQGDAVVLREFGSNKFMTKLNNAKWIVQNNRFDSMHISLSNETKNIAGYACKKATIVLKDGSNYTTYYTTAITPSVKEFEYQFKDVPGFVLEYEAQDLNGKKITYKATKLNPSPVPAAHFDLPTNGYRLLQ